MEALNKFQGHDHVKCVTFERVAIYNNVTRTQYNERDQPKLRATLWIYQIAELIHLSRAEYIIIKYKKPTATLLVKNKT